MGKKVKLLVAGSGRHGKDTFCEFLQTKGYTYSSSSWVAAEHFIFDALKDKYGYECVYDCWLDRLNHRAEWYDMICDFNKDDPARLSKIIFDKYDVYCGLRNPAEFKRAKEMGLFQLSIWVDATERLPAEGTDSNGITRGMCDIVLDNNGSLKEFQQKMGAFYEACLNR